MNRRDGQQTSARLKQLCAGVVLATAEQPLARQSEGYLAELALPASDIVAPRYGLAVWVTAGASQRPLQATGGWLPNISAPQPL